VLDRIDPRDLRSHQTLVAELKPNQGIRVLRHHIPGPSVVNLVKFEPPESLCNASHLGTRHPTAQTTQ
jgi:hypothetical protein